MLKLGHGFDIRSFIYDFFNKLSSGNVYDLLWILNYNKVMLSDIMIWNEFKRTTQYKLPR